MKAFVSKNIASEFVKATNVEAISLEPYEMLDNPVSTHADMLIFIMEEKLFCYDDYYKQNGEIFDAVRTLGYEIITVSKKCQREYPNDIALNVLLIGKKLFGSLKNIASEILDIATKKEYKLIDVKQGYSACATLVLDEKNVITADKGIYNAVTKEGIDALLITEGNIGIDKYNYGFIGGASFVLDDTVYFFGNIKKHPDYEKINQKINSCGKRIALISSGDVFDFGGSRLVFNLKKQ